MYYYDLLKLHSQESILDYSNDRKLKNHSSTFKQEFYNSVKNISVTIKNNNHKSTVNSSLRFS